MGYVTIIFIKVNIYTSTLPPLLSTKVGREGHRENIIFL